MENDSRSNLKEIREAAGLSRYRLAQLSGVTERGIAKWERGGVERAWAGKLKLVADALGCRIDDLL